MGGTQNGTKVALGAKKLCTFPCLLTSLNLYTYGSIHTASRAGGQRSLVLHD